MKIFSGSLLVAGTAIGAGMLALPVVTALGGLVPAIVIYLFCWLFMMATGLLFLEICLWLPQDANIVSMSGHLIGRGGKIISWMLYLFLFYSLTIAYIAGGGGFIAAIFGNNMPAYAGILIFTAIFAPIVYFGAKAVDRLNLVLMVGLIVSYFIFIVAGSGQINSKLLTTANWQASLLSLPIVFSSFSYQGIVPSLTSYLKRNVKWIRGSIIFGTSIPFIVYALWEVLILGIVPLEGANGLLEAKAQGLNAVAPLKHFVSSFYIYAIGQAFAFFALTTSFLGVTLGLLDFLADGLKVQKKGIQKLILCLMVFFPPLMVALSNPKIFLVALTYAGGIGCALLLGLMPIVLVWVGRYHKKLKTQEMVPGGKAMLVLLACFVFLELAFEFSTVLK